MRPQLIFTSLIFLTLSGCASNGSYLNTRATEVYATVVNSEKAPLVCVSKGQKSPLLGAIIGGVIGNQFGSGSGRKVATAGGAIIGANVANNSNRKNRHNQDCRSDGWINHIHYVNPYTQQMERTQIKTRYAQDIGTKIRTTINLPRTSGY